MNISDFLIRALVNTVEVQIQTSYSKWGSLIWICTVWSWLTTINYNYGKNSFKWTSLINKKTYGWLTIKVIILAESFESEHPIYSKRLLLMPGPVILQIETKLLLMGKPDLYGRDYPTKFFVSNLVFVFLRLQFYFVNYVIVSCELPYYNNFDQQMLLKN